MKMTRLGFSISEASHYIALVPPPQAVTVVSLYVDFNVPYCEAAMDSLIEPLYNFGYCTHTREDGTKFTRITCVDHLFPALSQDAEVRMALRTAIHRLNAWAGGLADTGLWAGLVLSGFFTGLPINYEGD
jgi:hypothetical protein